MFPESVHPATINKFAINIGNFPERHHHRIAIELVSMRSSRLNIYIPNEKKKYKARKKTKIHSVFAALLFFRTKDSRQCNALFPLSRKSLKSRLKQKHRALSSYPKFVTG